MSDILSDLIITKVYLVTSMYTPQNKTVKMKNRKRWGLVLKYEGETVYESNGKTFISDIDHPIILPKDCIYDWKCTEAGHCFIIDFECDASYSEPISFPIKNGEKILKLFKELEYKRNLQAPMCEIESIKDTYAIILNLARSLSEKYTPINKRRRIEKAIEYIYQNYDQNITNDMLAEICGVSTVYFRKLFCEVMGVSPITYAKQIRIEKAKEMLKTDYGNLSDIAQSLGYSNLYDFSRDFKKHTGVAPSKF